MTKTENRATKLIIVLGYNGTGKTTLVKQMVIHELKAKRRVLIVTPDDIEWNTIPLVHPRYLHRISNYVGARKLIYEPGHLTLIAEHYRNGMVIFDDCRAYLEARTDPDLHNLLIRRRQKMIDIVAVGHGFTEVPPKMFTFASDIILFKTMDNIKKREPVLKDYLAMVKHQREVNATAIKQPHYNRVIPQQ